MCENVLIGACLFVGIALFALFHQSLISLGSIGQSANGVSDAAVMTVAGRGCGQVTGLFPSLR